MEIPGNNQFRIKNKTIQDNVKISKKAGSEASAAPSKASAGAESIALSSHAKDIQKAHEVIKNSPDIRVDKINRIKNEIAEGQYHVDSKVLAEKILTEIITES